MLRAAAVLVGLMCVAAPSWGDEPELARCFVDAGARYGIATELLVAIGLVESGLDLDAENNNTNGSRDICVMQVNSWWLDKLARYGITEAHLRKDVCSCVHSGAWILAQEIHRHGRNWRAVGFYNSTRPHIQREYVNRVRGHMFEASELVNQWAKRYSRIRMSRIGKK